jgi:hypothetical protein
LLVSLLRGFSVHVCHSTSRNLALLNDSFISKYYSSLIVGLSQNELVKQLLQCSGGVVAQAWVHG